MQDIHVKEAFGGAGQPLNLKADTLTWLELCTWGHLQGPCSLTNS